MSGVSKGVQHQLLLEFIDNINDAKIKGLDIEKIFEDELNFDRDNYDFELYKIAYQFSDNQEKAKEKMDEYLLNCLSNNSKKDIIGEELKLIQKIICVVQFLTPISKKKYDDCEKDFDEAIILIALKKFRIKQTSSFKTIYHDLLPVIYKSDSFGKWNIDPLFGHMKIILMMQDKSEFPNKWILDNKTKFEFKKENLYDEDYESEVNDIMNNNQVNDKLDFVTFFTKCLEFNNTEVKQIIERLNSLNIYNIDDFRALNNEGWKLLTNQFPSKVEIIKDGFEKLGKFEVKLNHNEVPKYQQLANWHKVKRCLFYEANMIAKLNETGFLDKEALKGSIQNERENSKFNVGLLLDDIEKAFLVFTIPDKINIDKSTGMLLYGPPGTGKTSLMNMTMKVSGLTNLVNPMSASEINRSKVGESEELIRDIFNRAKQFPYLLCCIALDEIDSLAPDRSKETLDWKIAIVNQLLALMSGVTAVKNNYVIGATNHKNKIDEAFLRRLQNKFFVGYLNSNERLEIIKTLLKDNEVKRSFGDFNLELQNLLKTLTINFSGAATSEFKNLIYTTLLIKEDDTNFKLDKDILIALAEQIAQTHEITIGGLTIPSFIKSEMNFPKLSQCVNNLFTGRVLIDLTPNVKNIQFELTKNELFIFDLKSFEAKSVKHIIPIILDFTIELQLNYIRLLDSGFSAKNSKSSSDSAADAILNFLSEYIHFKEGVIIFDCDSLVGTSISGTTEIRFDPDKFNQSVSDSSAWQKGVLQVFNQKTIHDFQVPKKWYICATMSDFLVDKFKRDVCFPLTSREKDKKNIEDKNRLEEKVCLNCGKKYIEDENKVDSCNYHPDLLVCTIEGNKYPEGITKEELINLARKRHTEDIYKEYRFHCCMKGYTESDGCKSDKHSNTILRINNQFHYEIKEDEIIVEPVEIKNEIIFSEFVYLVSSANQKYLSVNENDFVFANSDRAGLDEKFQIIHYHDGSVSIMSMRNNSFLRIETNSPDNLLYANGAEAKAWERFHLIENVSSLDNTVSFELISNKKYLGVDGSGSFLIFANKVQKGVWESFYKEDEDIRNNKYFYKKKLVEIKKTSIDEKLVQMVKLKLLANSMYISVNDACELIADKSEISETGSETFELIYNNDGSIYIKSLINYLFVCVSEDSGKLEAKNENESDNGKFFIYENDNETVSLKSNFNDYYVSGVGLAPLIADKTWRQDCESFYISEI